MKTGKADGFQQGQDRRDEQTEVHVKIHSTGVIYNERKNEKKIHMSINFQMII